MARHQFTVQDVRYLRRNAGRMSREAIAAHIGCTVGGLKSKASKLTPKVSLKFHRCTSVNKKGLSNLQVAMVRSLYDGGFGTTEIYDALFVYLPVTIRTLESITEGCIRSKC
jgi:hypothetical protein